MIGFKGNNNIYRPRHQTLTDLLEKRSSLGLWVLEVLNSDTLLMQNGIDQAIH